MPLVAGEGRALRAHAHPPDDIERESMLRLRALAPCELPPPPADAVALRMAYAAGDASLLSDVIVPVRAVVAAASALRSGSAVITDTAMVAAGIRSSVAALGCEVVPAIDVGGGTASMQALSAPTRSAVAASTRAARGLVALADRWGGAVVVVGNAPTALLALLDALADGAPRPCAVVATPCGHVAAAEAKQLLIATPGLPAISVRGTRGGSAVAAAAVNACARLVRG